MEENKNSNNYNENLSYYPEELKVTSNSISYIKRENSAQNYTQQTNSSQSSIFSNQNFSELFKNLNNKKNNTSPLGNNDMLTNLLLSKMFGSNQQNNFMMQAMSNMLKQTPPQNKENENINDKIIKDENSKTDSEKIDAIDISSSFEEI